jgi:hypothetical protein
MQFITNLLVILRMAELALVDYFVMGEAIGIVATLFVLFYYSRKQMQKLSIDIETKFQVIWMKKSTALLSWQLKSHS